MRVGDVNAMLRDVVETFVDNRYILRDVVATSEDMVPADTRYWFPAKRYGWGWGLPIAWQGWLALVAFVVLVAAGALVFRPRHALLPYLVYVVVLIAVLTAICWFKGEPPRWRWGADE
jgi:hypothetical protein